MVSSLTSRPASIEMSPPPSVPTPDEKSCGLMRMLVASCDCPPLLTPIDPIRQR